MPTLLFRLALAFIFVCGLAPQPSFGQANVQYASRVVTSATAGIVADDSKAADGDLTTKAILEPTALGSYTTLRVAFKSVALANQPAGIYLKTDNSLSVDAAGAAAINTYLTTNAGTKLVKTYYNSDLVALGLGSSGVSNFSFLPTSDFNEIEVQYHSLLAVGKNIEVYEAYSTFAPPQPLPVALTAFVGRATATGGVALSWATASEQLNDHFVVERADGTPATFRALGQVAGGGTSAQPRQYTFVDATAGGLRYYRLRQVDTDGAEHFSPVVAVAAAPEAAGLVAYPCPTTGVLTIAGASGPQLRIFDQLGHQVRLADISAAQGPQVDVGGLPDGVYFLRDMASGQRTRFVKSSGY